MTQLLALAALGLGVGFIAGMFGIGGNFLLTPMLVVVMRVPIAIAVGSALCQAIGTSLVSFLKHRQLRQGEPRVDLVMLGGSLVGVDLGARLLGWLEAAGRVHLGAREVPLVTLVLDAAYAVLLLSAGAGSLWAAWREYRHAERGGKPALLLRLRIPPYLALPRLGGARASVIVMAYIGFFTGMLSGLLGIGGGMALLPILVYGYGFSIRDAAGTGILLLFVTVLAGTAAHAWHGHVDLRIALAILAGSSLGAQLGARATSRLGNQTLRLAFAVLLLGTVSAIAVDVVRTLRAG